MEVVFTLTMLSFKKIVPLQFLNESYLLRRCSNQSICGMTRGRWLCTYTSLKIVLTTPCICVQRILPELQKLRNVYILLGFLYYTMILRLGDFECRPFKIKCVD